MGVKCSLLGHDYGDADVERERAEDGDEVVRTARRVERCRNCGHERTVSENTEVTSLEAAAGVVREPDGTVVAAADGEFVTASEADGGITIEESLETRSESPSDGSTDPGRREPETGPIDRIDSETGETVRQVGPSRAPGEWPAEPRESRGVGSPAETGGLGATGSLATAESPPSWPGESNRTSGTETTETEPTDGRRPPSGSFECPSCGYSAAVVDSSLRAGDICPGCQHGYLAFETRKG